MLVRGSGPETAITDKIIQYIPGLLSAATILQFQPKASMSFLPCLHTWLGRSAQNRCSSGSILTPSLSPRTPTAEVLSAACCGLCRLSTLGPCDTAARLPVSSAGPAPADFSRHFDSFLDSGLRPKASRLRHI